MSSETPALTYRQLMVELGALCATKRTGTMFIATTDNHSARIGLVLGEIVALTFRAQRGMEAVDHLRKISAGRFSFSNSVMDRQGHHDLPDTADLLALLIGDDPVLPPQPRRFSSPAVPAHAGNAQLARAWAAIEEELTEFVGPIAPLLCRTHFERTAIAGPPWDWQSVVDAVAREISDPAKEERFKQQVLARLRDL